MRINPFIYGIFVLTIFLGVIYGFQTAGLWSVSGKLTASGEAVQPLAEDVSSIKGWMTLDQILSVYNVPLDELVAQFGLPADTPASAALKDLESDSFSVTDLRDWLSARTQQLPSETSNPTDPAIQPTPASAETLLAPQVELPAPGETALPTEHAPTAGSVTGKSTFQDLLDWGVAPEAIESILGGPVPDPSTVVKDYVTQQGMDFASIKNALQAVVP
jgi:hypothetical protein